MEKLLNEFNQLFDADPYLRNADLTVCYCEELESPHPSGATYRIALEQTVFYPEGGGQPGDTGFLGDVRVLDTHYVWHEQAGQNLIMHYTTGALLPGQSVTAVIDWERRFSFMQQHSGEHILSGLCHAKYGYDNVGFHLGETETTLDFSGPLTQEQIDELIQEANRLVWQNVPLEVSLCESDAIADLDYRSKLELQGKVRLVRIPGGDICACCGTHVSYSGEIGLILCTKSEKWKGGVRLTLLCGDRALRNAMQNQELLREMSKRLYLPKEELAVGIDRLEAKLATSNGVIRDSAWSLWNAQVPAFGHASLVRLSLPIFDDDFARLCVKAFDAEAMKASLLVIPATSGQSKLRFFLAEPISRAKSADSWLKLLRDEFGAKGGGPPQLSQGSLPDLSDLPEGTNLSDFISLIATMLGARIYVL